MLQKGYYITLKQKERSSVLQNSVKQLFNIGALCIVGSKMDVTSFPENECAITSYFVEVLFVEKNFCIHAVKNGAGQPEPVFCSNYRIGNPF